ncbi:SH3 domain-containing protein [Chryseobacterium sp. CT-SW4]|uniref:SH3 domain-containing protein n=1 Tax=Chryseobacterium sp. SW-1 TaxID=3157343 RepID=UPI003B01E6EE
MKKLLSIFITGLFILFCFISCMKANNNTGHDGKCTGSAYCTACSNCSRCGHCSSGGSCGVCRGSSSVRGIYSSPAKKTKSSGAKVISKVNNKSQTDQNSINSASVFYAKENIVNIYKGPGHEFPVIEKIKSGSKLILIKKHKNWLEVKIWKTGTEGFVFYQDVKN